MKLKIGENMKKILLLALIMIHSVGNAKVAATVDRNQIVIGETFTLMITMDENTSEQPDLSELQQAFKVLGSSQSSSTKIINNSYSVEKSWQISLMATTAGIKIIPAIKLGNQTTKPIQIAITKSDPNAKANGDIFIELTTNKDNAYVKEQIILTIKLFYAISLSEGSLSDPIASNTIITQLGKGATYTTSRDGKNYTVIERHYALFAEKSGMLELNPVIFNGRDNTSRRNFSMFSTGKPVRAVSQPISFKIKPIPQDSIGKGWIPASKVQISQQWTKPPYTVGEPLTRTITLYVEGLSETQIPEIELGDIEDIRIYPEQPQTQTEQTSQTLKAWKQVKIALIPTQAGTIRIPEYQLEWYNTETKKIQYAKLPPKTLQVDAGEFAIEKPAILNLNEKSQSGQTVSDVDSTNSSIEPVIKIVEKSNPIWKALTALFALLWMITLFYLIKKHPLKEKLKEKKTVIISQSDIVDAIKAADLLRLQAVLINWWNKQYSSEQVTNLSQIKQRVNESMKRLIGEVEQQLYQPNSHFEFKQEQWLKEVKANGLKLKKVKKNNKKIDLPVLY